MLRDRKIERCCRHHRISAMIGSVASDREALADAGVGDAHDDRHAAGDKRRGAGDQLALQRGRKDRPLTAAAQQKQPMHAAIEQVADEPFEPSNIELEVFRQRSDHRRHDAVEPLSRSEGAVGDGVC